jgi:hypothetical protein
VSAYSTPAPTAMPQWLLLSLARNVAEPGVLQLEHAKSVSDACLTCSRRPEALTLAHGSAG